MSSYQRQSLETVVINNGRSSKCATGSEVWNLNLDQIESGTGRVLAKQIVSVDGLGPSTFPFEAGTVLYSKLRPYLNKVIVADEAGVATTELVPLRCDPEKLLPEYLAYYLRSPEFLGFANVVVAGAKMPRMVMGEFWKHQIPLPPLPEQRRIAAILDQADILRAKRREALAELDQLTQSIFIEMFGDPVTNPKGWPTKKLCEVGTLDRGVSKHRPRNDPKLLGGKYPLIQTGDVANCNAYIHTHSSTYSELGLKQSKLWPAGTLCITIAANIAKTGILRIDACFPDSVVGFRAASVATVEYVRVWLSFLQKMLEESAPESAQKNINLAMLRELEVPLPPISEQELFHAALLKQGAVNASLVSSQADLNSLFSSLQHRAFRGEL